MWLAAALLSSGFVSSSSTRHALPGGGARCGICARVSIQPADESSFRKVSLLTAAGICKPEDDAQLIIIAAALQRDLQNRFTRRNRAAHDFFLAKDDDSGEIVGCVGIDVQRLSSTALGEPRIGPSDTRLDERPLLSSLAVSPEYRKKGIAMRLCRAAEDAARGWGFSEVLLKVESDNGKALNLYRRVGYRKVAVDKEAERPVAGSGGLKFVRTTQVAMRKDLRFPPVDTVATALASAIAVYYAVGKLDGSIESLAASGSLIEALQHALRILTS